MKAIYCKSCGKRIDYAGRGAPPKRHPACNARVRKMRDRLRKRRERNQQGARDAREAT